MIDEQDRGIYDPAEPAVHEYGAEPRSRASGETTVGLLSGLAHDVSTLVKQEAALVRAELAEKVDQAKAGVGEAMTGALVAFSGFLFVLLAGVLALDEVLDRPWLSALIVGGVVLLVGLMFLKRGQSNLKTTNLVPERAKEQLKEDARLVKETRQETARAVTPRAGTTGGVA